MLDGLFNLIGRFVASFFQDVNSAQVGGTARETARAWFAAAIKSGNSDARNFLAKYAR